MKRGAGILICACALLVLTAGSARAAFGLSGFQFEVNDKGGLPVSEAGEHPYSVITSFQFNTVSGDPKTPDQQIRDLAVELPTGFAGAPGVVPTCSHAEFFSYIGQSENVKCSDDTAIGVAHVEFNMPGPNPERRPVYNLAPPPGAVAEFGFSILRNPVFIDFRVSQSFPYNVVATLVNTPQTVRIFGSRLEIWGVPADPAHDEDRGACAHSKTVSKCPSDAPDKAFVTLPRACEGPLTTAYRALSWQSLDGCGQCSFAARNRRLRGSRIRPPGRHRRTDQLRCRQRYRPRLHPVC